MKFIESEKKVNAFEIQEFESKYDIVFPSNLSGLLLKYNGGN